ncbi:MAG TPA: Gfo/Idh/MocA family oxidoreductase [Lacipirellulaceae bacterium]|nr:Gfo/Idh/MocA family oxidoreductase [Lacipirellulaceae bacterium]
MKELRFVMFGAGFWAPYQLAGWQELSGARCVGIFNRTLEKARQLAERFGIDRISDDPTSLLESGDVDFVDVVTDPGTHRKYVELAADRGLPAICQKPLATTFEDARAMVEHCRRRGTALLVNENWRWQTPLRAVKQVLGNGVIGDVFRGRVCFNSGFPVFDNQPFLKSLERFIICDVGVHILDAIRFLFGEATRVSCEIVRVNPNIRGEDVATLMLAMQSGATVTCELSYASRLACECFPQTLLTIEGSAGSIELMPDYVLRTTAAQEVRSERWAPPHYRWADPAYDVVHASIPACQEHLLQALRGEQTAETSGEDNLRTLQLVEAAYQAAATHQVVAIPPHTGT